MSQLGLFEGPVKGQRGDGSAAFARLRLDAHAWVEHRTAWLTGHAELFETLRRDVQWHAERREMYDAVIDVPG